MAIPLAGPPAGMTKSPTIRLLFGLLVTLAAVLSFSWYAIYQISGLRKLQSNTIDLNQHDSLLLLKVQNDLNMIGLNLRDMSQASRASEILEYRGEFARLRTSLEAVLRADARLRPSAWRDKQGQLKPLLDQLWRTSDEVFRQAAADHAAVARKLILTELSVQQPLLATEVSGLLQRNTEAEEGADQKVSAIYDRAEWNAYGFLAATILAIAATTLYLIYSNRRLFQRLTSLSRQHRVLAVRLINLQEEVLRSVSRELHDEFGQILTAVSAMLGRAERKGVPPDSPLRTELSEVREITHNTLEKMRSLSQMLHPAILDDYGLAKGIEWYADIFRTSNRHSDHGYGPRTRGPDCGPTRNSLFSNCSRGIEQCGQTLAHKAGGNHAGFFIRPADGERAGLRDWHAAIQERSARPRPDRDARTSRIAPWHVRHIIGARRGHDSHPCHARHARR